MIAVGDSARSVETTGVPHPLSRPGETKHFTLEGSDELEAHLERTCQQVLARVRRLIPERKLEGLLVGGGYGRGEGGVLKTEAGDRPYNDLELYVFLRGNNFVNQRRYQAPLHELGKRLSPPAGVEVEFKVLSVAKLRRSPSSMFYYDLVAGHHRLWGEESLLSGCGHHRAAERIPLCEATRLLMNRCSGLLFARERLECAEFSPVDADFVERNLAKAQLAFGDAILTAFGRYHWSCLERHKRLKSLKMPEALPWWSEVQRHHFSGVDFKLRPRRVAASRAALLDRHEELSSLGLQLWLWLERRRLNCPFDSARDYALSSVNKCPETSGWRNALLNLRTFQLSVQLNPGSWRYPRERVLHALAWLLWQREESEESELLRCVGRELRVVVRSFSDAVAAYTAFWRQFS